MIARQRFISLSDEIGGVLKTFFIIWAIYFGIIFCATGCNKWGFWAGIGLGLLLTLPTFFLLTRVTGVKREKMSEPKQKIEMDINTFREIFK